MPRLSWGTTGKRYYETGVDRGVLYVDEASGVAWNGLISIIESLSGGEPKPYYLDGFKFLNLSSVEEYAATIQAFSSPPEFDVCDGNISMYPGLFITRQRRKSFGLCYRTKLGNDIDGVDHGYKIWLIYGALAAPTASDNTTINDSPEPIAFSWAITATPPLISDFRPTAQLIIDSRTTDSALLTVLEDIFYGSLASLPRLPALDELIVLFADYDEFKVTLLGDGVYSADGPPVEIISSDIFALDHDRVIDNGDGSFIIL